MDHICSCLVCSLQPCGHLLGRGLPLDCDVLLCYCHFPVWCPWSGVVLDISIPDLYILSYFVGRI